MFRGDLLLKYCNKNREIKINLMNYLKLLLVFVVAVTLLYFLKDREEDLYDRVYQCNSVAPELRFSCYRSEIEKYYKGSIKNFINNTENNPLSFKSGDSSYAIFGTNCHTFYHAIGDFIGENVNSSDISSSLSLCPLSCTSGCMMGLYKRTALKNNFSTGLLKDFYDFCRTEEKDSCAHEIGHLLNDKYTYSILRILDELSEKEYGLPRQSYNYITFEVTNFSAPFEECEKLVPKEKLDKCFTGIGHNLFIFSEFSKDGFKSMFKECEKVEDSHRDDCFAFLIFRIGINEVAPRFLSGKPEEGNRICDEVINMTKQKLEFHCYTGLGGGIGLFIDSEYSSFKINAENIIGIKQNLLNFAKLCEKAKTNFTDNCYAGLFGTRFGKLYDEFDIYDEKLESILSKINKDFVVVG